MAFFIETFVSKLQYLLTGTREDQLVIGMLFTKFVVGSACLLLCLELGGVQTILPPLSEV